MEAELIILSKRVFTGLDDEPQPAAIAIADRRIIAVESLDSYEGLRGAHTQVVDYGDALITAGLHDSHLHFFHSALYASPLAERYLGKNEEDCVERLAELAARRPGNSWLLTQGWREYRWDPPCMPSKHSLDAAYPDRPVAMYSGDAHTLWLNSKAMEELGLTKDSQPCEGGIYDRDDQGELTGLIREAAAMELMPRIVASFTQEELCQAYAQFMQHLNSFGITSVCDVSLMALPGLDFVRDDIFGSMEEDDALTVRVHMFPTLLDDMSRFEEMHERYQSDMLQTPGFKQFFDGVSSQHTAYVKEPYTNARFEGDCGKTTVPPERMEELVLSAASKHYPVRIHAIGDEAIHIALDIFEKARELYGPLPSGQNSLEHLENFQAADMQRLADLDVLASVQPCHITLDPGGPERDLGPERVPYMWPFATLLRLGCKLSLGTDAPVTDINSLPVIYTATTRKDATSKKPEGGWLPQERISMAQTLRAYTLGSAQAAGRASELGTLEAGKYADLAVFDTDLFTCDEDEILETRVLATYVGGTCVYSA